MSPVLSLKQHLLYMNGWEQHGSSLIECEMHVTGRCIMLSNTDSYCDDQWVLKHIGTGVSCISLLMII